jgi:hypothetical protein
MSVFYATPSFFQGLEPLNSQPLEAAEKYFRFSPRRPTTSGTASNYF